MKLETLKENVESWWGNVADGWRQLWRAGSEALTRFRPGEKTDLPARATVDEEPWPTNLGWSVLGGEVFEDDSRVVVRLEIPGLEKEELQIEVDGDRLVVSGEKRFERESTEGRWRVMQCAYGAFRRVVTLPAAVRAEAAEAGYRNGVLRVDLPKLAPGKPHSVKIRVG
jgi:HSP20 family protein